MCNDGWTSARYCGIALVSGSVASACDPFIGACVPTGPCASGERCDPTGRYALRCDATWGREVASACAGCRPDGSGSGVMCD